MAGAPARGGGMGGGGASGGGRAAEDARDLAVAVVSYVLLFLLVFGLSGTVELSDFKEKFRELRGIAIGAGCQFVLLPLCGYVSVRAFDLPPIYGITLMVVTSSPGGSYSNLWCSIINADLPLSVAMTTVSSFVSMFMLPINIVIYVRSTYAGQGDVKIDWVSMGTAIAVVISAVGLGLYVGEKHRGMRGRIHKLGNVSGVALIALGFTFSSMSRDDSEPIWSRPWRFYAATAVPCLVGLLASLALSALLKLPKPQSLAVCIETCYQNTGVSLAVALSMFQGGDAALAAGLPVFYQVCQGIFILVLSVVLVRMGWSYAPADARLWEILFTNWQPRTGRGHRRKPSGEVFLEGDRAPARRHSGRSRGNSRNGGSPQEIQLGPEGVAGATAHGGDPGGQEEEGEKRGGEGGEAVVAAEKASGEQTRPNEEISAQRTSDGPEDLARARV